MAKNKLQKYARVKHLPNVTISEFSESDQTVAYPWDDPCHEGMKRVLELGCGKGEHTLAFAASNPSWFCVGIDYKSHRICVGAQKAMDKGLENVHFFRVQIESLKEFFTEHSIHEIWLTFPDPHPKKRSIKSRLSAPSFLDMYAYLLVPGGTVHLKTDSDLLYNYTLESVKSWGGKVVAASDDIHASEDTLLGARSVASTFEGKALSKGLTIKYMTFTLP